MDIKELANKYRAELPEGLTDIEFLKAIYIKLGYKKAFDERYYFGNSSTMKKIYKLAEREKHNSISIDKKRTIICYSLSYEIRHLLREFGYHCFVTTSCEMGDHVFPIVTLPDGRRIKYDLQKDLENIQTHCKTEFFATVDNDDYGERLSVIDEDTQFEIDKKIGYVSEKDDYRDSDIDSLDSKLIGRTDLTLWQKLSIILSDSGINNIPENTGYIEIFRYYSKRIMPRYFTSKELSGKIHLITCAKGSKDNPEYTNCIFVEDRSAPKQLFIFSRVHNKYIPISYDGMLKLEEEGLIIGNNFPSNGASKLKKELEIHKKVQEQNQDGASHTEH